ncbi:MAG TPA: MFS transporter [Acidobacteriota bacterium]|nr:MFS transporter [Acidobacteriota bacterium]
MGMSIQSEKADNEITPKQVGGDEKPHSRYAWYVLAILTGMYMFSFVDRQILSLLVPSIKRDLGVSDSQIGLLQGLAFALFYTFMGLPLGRTVDSCNRRNIIAVCITIWSFFTALCAVARSYFTLFLTRVGVGVGEAGLSPAAFSLIADYFPKERIGTAISVYYFGLFLGSSLALLVGGITVDALASTPFLTVPVLGTIASWRITFLIVGLPGLVFALLAFTVREPLRRNLMLLSDGRAAGTSFREAFVQMRLKWKSVLGTSVGMIFQSTCNYAVTMWAPTFFLRVHGWKAAQAGKALAVIMIVFACGGMYVGGILSDRWQKRGIADGPIRVAVISAVGIFLFLTPAALLSDVRWTLALMGVGMFLLSLPMGVAVAALQLIFPNQVRGQVAALFLFFLNLGGQTMGGWLPGFFNDYLFHNEHMIGTSISLTVGAASVLMLFVFLATMRPYRTHYRMMQDLQG